MNASTNGIFTFKDNILYYDALKYIQVSFFIAIMEFQGSQIGLRAIATENGFVPTKCNINLEMSNGKYFIDQQYAYCAAMIFGLKPRSAKFKLQIKSKDATKLTANWSSQSGWKIVNVLNAEHVEPHEQNDVAKPQAGLNANDRLHCLNCDGEHDIELCKLPMYSWTCHNCLIISCDSYEHTSPCNHQHRVCGIRRHILTSNALTLYHSENDTVQKNSTTYPMASWQQRNSTDTRVTLTLIIAKTAINDG